VNKIFISGSVGANPQVSYTPKGKKILRFPMLVEDGGFSIDVIFAGGSVVPDPAATIGKRVLVTGALAKMKTQSTDVLRVKASKILPMEE
jgi:primosomal replication protein N